MTIASADSVGFNSIEQTKNNTIEPAHKIKLAQNDQHESKQYQINLSENVGVGENGNSPKEKQNDVTEKIANTQISLNLSEKLSASENNFDQDTIAMLKENSDRKATMERIWNTERIRFNGKSIVQNNELLNDQLSSGMPLKLLDDVIHLAEKFDIKQSTNNVLIILNKILFVQPVIQILDVNEIHVLSETYSLVKNNVVSFAYGTIDSKNPTILLLLVPLSGYILIRSEEEKFQFFNKKKSLSFVFIVILLSSSAITPFSISTSYWEGAYADTGNSIEPIGPSDNPVVISNSTSITNSTEIDPPINSTISIPDNSTEITPSIPDNSTEITPSIPDNSTEITPSIPDNSTEITPSVPENEEIQSIPNATQSWQFNEAPAGTDIELEEGVNNNTSIDLQGDQYITQNITSTNELTNLSVSTWVKPDYESGSPEFTIISKENSFVLSINNNIPPQKIAKFSVFDGIKWYTVESTIEIPQEWTHIAATYNSTAIAIYVNGVQESTASITGIPTISVNGQLKASTVDSITSDSDVVIGAYISTRKGTIETSNSFSGQIDNVNLYDLLLEGQQILALYGQNAQIPEIVQMPVNATVTLTNATLNLTNATVNITNSTITNATTLELIVTPELQSAKDTYLITENPQLEFQYFTDEDILRKAQSEITQAQNRIESGQVILNETDPVAIVNAQENIITTQKKIISTQEQIQQTLDDVSQGPHDQQTQDQIENTIDVVKETLDQIEEAGIVEYDNTPSIQSDVWHGDNSTITVQVLDPAGNSVDVNTTFEQVIDGKFNIELESTRDATPGVYTVTTTLTKDGETYTVQDEFAWGLVSLNTKKSIYRPGETADFVIVVLDNQGHPVCDANLLMTITDPSSQTTTLSSGNGVTPNPECGLYDSKYTTSIEGNHTVNITAQTSGIDAAFSTSFLVQQNFDYDVIRTAQSKIDPVNNPNLFDVAIAVESFVGSGPVTIREYVPAVFDVSTDGNVETIGDTKILTWNKDLTESKTSVRYSYSVPLEFPKLYALGKTEIEKSDGSKFTEARNWFVAADPAPVISNDDAMLAYASSTNPDLPRIRAFDSNANATGKWSNEVSLPSAGAEIIINLVIKHSPVSNKIVLVTLGNDGSLDSYVCTANCTTVSNWTVANDIGQVHGFAASTSEHRRSFDLTFETSTGDALLVYGVRNTATTADLGYRVLPDASTTWNAEILMDDKKIGTDISYSWINMASKPTASQEIALVGHVVNSTDDVHAFVWDGNDFTNANNTISLASTATLSHEHIDVEYTADGSQAMVVAGDGTTGNVNSATWDGATWTNRTIFDITTAGGDVTFSRLIPRPAVNATVENDIQAVFVDSASDLGTAFWDGATWSTVITIDGTIDVAGTQRPADFAWFSNGTGKLVWGTATGTLTHKKCNPHCTAANPINTLSGFSNIARWISLTTNPHNKDTVQMLGLRVNDGSQFGGFLLNATHFDNYGDQKFTSTFPTSTTEIYEAYSLSFRITSIVAALSESATISDTVSKSFTKSLSESATISDTLTTAGARSITLSESARISDTVSTAATKSVTLSESARISDTVSTAASFTKSLSESLAISDTVTTAASKLVSLSESLRVSDTLTTAASFTKSLSESLRISDTLTTTGARSITLSESARISDTFSRTGTFFRTLSEHLKVDDVRANNIAANQQLVSNLATAVTVDSAKPELVITSSNAALSTVTVPSTVTEPTINYATILVANAVTITNSLTIDTDSSIDVLVTMPAGITISGTSWTGVLNLPTVKSATSVTAPSESGVTNTIRNVVEIGFGSTSLTFDKAVRLKFVGEAGKNVGYAPSGGTLTEITTTCSDDTQATNNGLAAGGNCKIDVGSDLVVWTKHFTSFATFSSSSTSSTSAASTTRTSPGGHSTGVGPLGAAGAGAGFGGILEPTEPIAEIIDITAPKIFDVKFQLDNGTKFRSAEITNQYVNDQSMTVYSIVDSLTPIKRAELRFIKIGDPINDYTAIVMDVQPLQISNSTYTVSGTIPLRLTQEPAITYWVHVLNEVTKVTDSDKYNIGVKPTYSADGKLELDMQHNRAEGATGRPTAYFTNTSDKPVYGIISLIIDGKTVHTSEPQLLESGVTKVTLIHETPVVGNVKEYEAYAKAEFYGESMETEKVTIYTFPATTSVYLSKPNEIEIIKNADGGTVASPTILYASFKDEGNMRYRVIAPDGTCVIGGSEECLVTQSTTGLQGNFKSIMIGEQVYRVKYSGPENPLERFSITSIDPITGQWQVEIDSEDGLVPQAHAMKDAFFKVKYRAEQTQFVSESN